MSVARRQEPDGIPSQCLAQLLDLFRRLSLRRQHIEKSQQFFRFNPTNGTFDTLPIAATDWTTLCDKVSTDIMERVVL